MTESQTGQKQSAPDLRSQGHENCHENPAPLNHHLTCL